ncbi:MAG: hypothetical protein HY318_01555 [Armatimonadetes bacterium]|nr:hypothetical protein [Armatimonadota bacterium]
MDLLIRLELKRLKNSLRNLARSPVRLIVSGLTVLLILFGLAGQLALLFAPVGSARSETLAGFTGSRGENLGPLLFLVLLWTSYHVIDSGLRGGLLAFNASEVDFLFPSPLPRRTVLLFKLSLDYVKLGGSVALVFLWLMPQTRLCGAQHTRAALLLSPWAVFFYYMFLLNVSHLFNFLYTFHAERMRYLPFLVKASFAGCVTLILLLMLGQTPAGGWLPRFTHALRSTTVSALLFPLIATWEALMAPFNGLPPVLLQKILGLASLAVVSFGVLMSRPENIYEPTIGVSLLRSQIRAATRSGNWQAARALWMLTRKQQTSSFRLAPFGYGSMSLVWKSLALSLRNPARTLVFCLAVAVLSAIGLRYLASKPWADKKIIEFAPLLALYVCWIVGMTTFNLQRSDLRQANVLKPLPIPPWQVALAQTLPLTLGTSVGVSLSLLMMALAVPAIDARLCVAIGLALPAMMLLLSAGNLGLATMFPNPTDPVQNMSAGFAGLIMSAMLMAPTFGTGAILWALGMPGWVVGAGGGFVAAVMAGLTLAVAGALYRRFDPTE